MAKIKEHKFEGGVQYWFWCPGCEYSHAFTVPPWTFNGDLEKPSFTPSLLCNQSHPESRCHSWVTDGMIQFFVIVITPWLTKLFLYQSISCGR